MKKNDQNIKPIFHEQLRANANELQEIQNRFFYDQQFISNYKQRLQYFEKMANQPANGHQKHRNNRAKNNNKQFKTQTNSLQK